MSFNDTVSDMLTRIRNAARNRSDRVNCRNSKVCVGIARVLKEEGFIADFAVIEDELQGILRIDLRYGPGGDAIISRLQRVSKPSCRVYKKSNDLPRPLEGLGVAIVSTSKGVLSDRQAREQHIGGELLCTVQ